MDNIALARMLYDAFKQGQIDTVISHSAEDARWESVGDPAHMPHAGVFQGRAGATAFFEVIGRSYAFELFSPDEFYASGDRVFCFGHVEGRSTATGRPINNRFLHTFRFRNDSVAEFTEFTDTARIAVGCGTLRPA